MNVFVILATGPSLSQDDVDYVRGKAHVIAVSDAYTIAPWADCLVSNDHKWWVCHPRALQFAGRKFCYEQVQGVEQIKGRHNFRYGLNSGLRACQVAYDVFGATRILLLGFDLHSRNGAHFFGPHAHPKLKNSTPERQAIHVKQFQHWDGCQITNCTPGSALTQFPIVDIREVLLP